MEEGRPARKRVRHLNVEGPLGALSRAPLADRGTRTLLNGQCRDRRWVSRHRLKFSTGTKRILLVPLGHREQIRRGRLPLRLFSLEFLFALFRGLFLSLVYHGHLFGEFQIGAYADFLLFSTVRLLHLKICLNLFKTRQIST